MPSPKILFHKDKIFHNFVHGEFDDREQIKIIGTGPHPGRLGLRYRHRLEWGVDTSKNKGTSVCNFFSPIDEEI